VDARDHHRAGADAQRPNDCIRTWPTDTSDPLQPTETVLANDRSTLELDFHGRCQAIGSPRQWLVEPTARRPRHVRDRTTTSGSREIALPIHRSRRWSSQRAITVPWSLTLAHAAAEIDECDNSRLRMSNNDRENFGANGCIRRPRAGDADLERSTVVR
jgi:hypothetical protein